MRNPNPILVFFGTLIAIVLIIAVYFNVRKNKALQRLWNEYQIALRGSDRRKALDAGRKYYSRLRGGSLTTYDEQAIANDLSTMK